MSKIWVVSDIHGCLKSLRSLIENLVVPSKNDTLCFVGDYIDRGPDSKGVIDYVRSLHQQGFSIIALKGNHEEFLANSFVEEQQRKGFLFFKPVNKSREMWAQHGGLECLKSFKADTIKDIPGEYIDWVSSRPLTYKVDNFLVVHAGLNFKLDNPMEDERAMLWIRDYRIDPAKINYRKLIHGHVPVSLDFIDLTIRSGNFSFIDIDNGCYMKNKTGFGNLLALELNSMDLKVQPNLDM